MRLWLWSQLCIPALHPSPEFPALHSQLYILKPSRWSRLSWILAGLKERCPGTDQVEKLIRCPHALQRDAIFTQQALKQSLEIPRGWKINPLARRKPSNPQGSERRHPSWATYCCEAPDLQHPTEHFQSPDVPRSSKKILVNQEGNQSTEVADMM